MTPTPPRSRKDWNEVIERMEAALAQALQQNPEPASLVAAEPADALNVSLSVLERRLAEMRAALERAESNAADTDALLGGEVETVERWTAMMKQVRETLASF
jgi:hypothetical protein